MVESIDRVLTDTPMLGTLAHQKNPGDDCNQEANEMSPQEAKWMGARLAGLPVEAISPLVNLGSSTAAYRAVVCPLIDHEIFEPLAKRGVEVIHVDLKAADGVDIVGDLSAETVQAMVRARKPKALICTSLLEHLIDRSVICEAIENTLADQGYLLLSVPHRYPYHPDPIDTGFRPSPDQLGQQFRMMNVIETDSVSFGNYLGQLEHKPWLIARDAYLLFAGFTKEHKWKVFFSNYSFLFRTYVSSCAVMRKN